MTWLADIIQRGRRLRTMKKLGIDLPANSTDKDFREAVAEKARELGINITADSGIDDFRREAIKIGQMVKEAQNASAIWSPEQWRRISKAIENLEKKK